MNPTLPLPASGYTLHVFTMAKRGFGPTQHVARLVSSNGRVCNEWTLSAARWQLKRQVAMLRDNLDEMLGGRTTLPIQYAEPPKTYSSLREVAV